MDFRRHLTGQNIALVTVFAGFIAASTLWSGVTLAGGIPITLQTFAVLLAGAVLGPWRGAAAVVIYLILGTAGLPVFAQRGSTETWFGPSAGFLIGFVACAFVTGWLVRGLRSQGKLTFSGAVGACAIGSLVVLNVIGWGYWMWRTEATLEATLVIMAAFVIGDVLKVVLAALVATSVHRAYPWILPAKSKAQVSPDAQAEAASGTGDPAEESDALATA